MTNRADNPTPVVRSLGALNVSPADAVVSFANQPGGFALESVCNTAGYGRFSIFGARPIHRVRAAAGDRHATEQALCELNATLARDRVTPIDGIPFPGGWVGGIPYETGVVLTGIGKDPIPTDTRTPLEFGLYDTAAIYDHVTFAWQVCAVDLPQSVTPASQRAIELAAELADCHGAAERIDESRSTLSDPPIADTSHTDYLAKVNRAIAYIAAGDIYQVNLTQRFTAQHPSEPVALYLALRRANPADFAAFLRMGDRTVLSASPELFLAVEPDGAVITRPIKGTRPRGADPESDLVARQELAASAKDTAELNMIIDLLRNDLGRVCSFGSVQVREDGAIETHPTVHHRVATVTGTLRSDVSPVNLLCATLPGGSITGCPKIRAMQIIRELEVQPRGAYCGALGTLGLDGRVMLNVAIRTLEHLGDRVHIHAGGAITADSDPEAEYAETLAKAEGMFRALGHTTTALATPTLDASAAVR